MIYRGKYRVFEFPDLEPEQQINLVMEDFKDTVEDYNREFDITDIKMTKDGLQCTLRWANEDIVKEFSGKYYTQHGYWLTDLNADALSEEEIADEIQYHLQDDDEFTQEEADTLLNKFKLPE